MVLPFPFFRARGLEKVGFRRWRSVGDDPQFVFRFRPLRPRVLVLVLDALGGEFDPVIYLDRGYGFTEEDSVGFSAEGRSICCIELVGMPEVRAIRVDPMERAGDLRFTALAISSLKIARAVTRWLDRDRRSFRTTRIHTIGPSDSTGRRIEYRRDYRRYRSAADHYADVIAMLPENPAPTEPSRLLVSFLVPTYNTLPGYLDDLLASFLAQPAGLAELVISDDGSTAPRTLAWLRAKQSIANVRILVGAENTGIAGATNRALSEARAPWVSFMDHDDALSVGAVEQIARALEAHPEAQFLYTDEVVTDEALAPVDYLLKPAYDPVLLSGVNYINHLSVYRRERVIAVGACRQGVEGSQDYDLLLRYLGGLSQKEVLHLPFPAYLWRRHETSYSTTFKDKAIASARQALAESYRGDDAPADVEPALLPDLHRVRLDRQRRDWGRVSVIIPNRDSFELLSTVLAGLSQTDYDDVEIIVADNDSTDLRVVELYATFEREGRPLLIEPVRGEFNFSRSINAGVSRATGEYLLLLNNDIQIIESGWLKEMVSCFAFEDTGIVGARLLYPDRTIQHAGVIVGLGGLAGHWYGGKGESFPGPLGRLAVRQSLTAVTGAAMLVSRACFRAVGSFDEELFAIAYNDVDFCLRAQTLGFRTVWTPFATLVHHESASRGSDIAPDKIDRFRREQDNLRSRHATDAFVDRAFNPWYRTDRSVPSLRNLDELPQAR